MRASWLGLVVVGLSIARLVVAESQTDQVGACQPAEVSRTEESAGTLQQEQEIQTLSHQLEQQPGNSASIGEIANTKAPHVQGAKLPKTSAQGVTNNSAEPCLAIAERRIDPDTKKEPERRAAELAFSGDLSLRHEAFLQNGAMTRQRERLRLRLNITSNLTDTISGGLSVTTGGIDDPTSSYQTVTELFAHKPIRFDRYFLTYQPNSWKALTLTAGKFAYPWYRTPLTFDNDINPEGIAQTLRFDSNGPRLKNVTLVGFQLPFHETGHGYGSFIFGGQVQTHWRLSDKAMFRVYGAGVNVTGADSIAAALAKGTLRPGLPSTNRLRVNSSGDVIGYQSRFLYLDLIGVLDYRLHMRLPLQVQFNLVNNIHAATRERRGYWAEIRLGRPSEPKEFQLGYTLVRIEPDAVIGAFNESDLRAPTNVLNHRITFGYQIRSNILFSFTLWLGRLAKPHSNPTLVAPDFHATCASTLLAACGDPYLKRMQFDITYKF